MINFIKNLFKRKEIRFLFVGGINTVVGYGSYALFIFLGLNYVAAQTFSTIIGVINSYFWNKYFTFKQPYKSFAEIIKFLSVYLVSYLMNLLILYIFVDILKLNEYAAGLLGLIFTTLISYFGHNYFSFRKRKSMNKEHENEN